MGHIRIKVVFRCIVLRFHRCDILDSKNYGGLYPCHTLQPLAESA